MTEIESHYRTENGSILIEMRLRTVMQIFNSLNPSPFHEKDLDPDAEAYITEIVQDFPLAQPMKIVIHLPCREAECEEAGTLEMAIRNHYNYLEASAAREMRLKFRQGRVSLAIGISLPRPHGSRILCHLPLHPFRFSRMGRPGAPHRRAGWPCGSRSTSFSTAGGPSGGRDGSMRRSAG